MLRVMMRARTHPAADHADDLDDGDEIRMPEFASNTTREELAASGVMVLGFVLSAGVALGVLWGFVAITGG